MNKSTHIKTVKTTHKSKQPNTIVKQSHDRQEQYKSQTTLPRQSLNPRKQATKQKTQCAYIHFQTNGTHPVWSQSSHHKRSVGFYHANVHDNDSVNETLKAQVLHGVARRRAVAGTSSRFHPTESAMGTGRLWQYVFGTEASSTGCLSGAAFATRNSAPKRCRSA